MADARADLGVLLFDKEDYQGERREIEAALKVDPESYIANRTLMQLYAWAKDPWAEAQAERLKTLVEDRNKKMQMMLRTIEVRPY